MADTNTAAKIAALDRLASTESAAPGERRNARLAAAALRAREALTPGRASATAALLDLVQGLRRPPATPVRQADAPRCAAYRSATGERCQREPLPGGKKCRSCQALENRVLGLGGRRKRGV